MDEGFRFPLSRSLAKFFVIIKRGVRFLLESRSEKSNEEILSPEHKKALHDAYVAQRAEANKFALEIAGRYERTLLFIAGGALTVSLAFIEKIAPSPVPCSRGFALASWIGFALAIVSSLLAISRSQDAVYRQMDILDIEIWQKLYPEDERYKGKDTNNPFTKKVESASKISFRATIFGLIALIIFAAINFLNPNPYERKKTNATTDNPTKASTGREEGKLQATDKPSSAPAPAFASKTRKVEDASKTEIGLQANSTNKGAQGELQATAKSSPSTSSQTGNSSEKVR